MADYNPMTSKASLPQNAGLSAILVNLDDLNSQVESVVSRLEHIHTVIYGPIPMPRESSAKITAMHDSIEGHLQRLRTNIGLVNDRLSAIEIGGRT